MIDSMRKMIMLRVHDVCVCEKRIELIKYCLMESVGGGRIGYILECIRQGPVGV